MYYIISQGKERTVSMGVAAFKNSLPYSDIGITSVIHGGSSSHVYYKGKSLCNQVFLNIAMKIRTVKDSLSLLTPCQYFPQVRDL